MDWIARDQRVSCPEDGDENRRRLSARSIAHMKVKEASYTTLLMATGLTFGTISSLYGLQNGIIDQNQYTILVSVVILSAFVPTLIAQKFFQPTVEMMHAWGHLYRRRLSVLSVEDTSQANNSAN